jgi:hypothetical protein
MGDYYDPNSDYNSIISLPQQSPQERPQETPTAIDQEKINAAPNIDPKYLYSWSPFQLEWREILRRVIKYLLEGLAVAFVAYYVVGKGKLNMKDVVILGVTAAFIFAILDTFSPTVALGVRFGAGFGIGQNLFGVGPLSSIAGTTAVKSAVI